MTINEVITTDKFDDIIDESNNNMKELMIAIRLIRAPKNIISKENDFRYIRNVGATFMALGNKLFSLTFEGSEILSEWDWKYHYFSRLITLGFTYQDAKDTTEAADFDPECSPEEAAENEFDYAMEDS